MGQIESSLQTASPGASRVSDEDICDAYLYLLGRLLILRQEHLDLEHNGMTWNELVHREVGGVQWANPNLDVAYSEAWVAVDDSSYTMLELPLIAGRYYTVQIVNPWGETIANINERTYPTHPAGAFALYRSGATISVPPGTKRIELPGKKARVLARIELGKNPSEAIALQQRMSMRAVGTPTVTPPVDIPLFRNDQLPGVEAFDSAFSVLAADPDSNTGTAVVQAKLGAVVAACVNPGERARIDSVIRELGWPALERAVVDLGVAANGWTHPRVAGTYGDDWLGRTAVNLVGIWANNLHEVVYFGAGTSSPLLGSNMYTMTFAKQDLPNTHASYFWSVTCVDATTYRVIPNPIERYVLNRYASFAYGDDGSLTLYFAPQRPANAPEANWLPTPAGQKYVLTWRSYGPDPATVANRWFPPPLKKR